MITLPVSPVAAVVRGYSYLGVNTVVITTVVGYDYS